MTATTPTDPPEGERPVVPLTTPSGGLGRVVDTPAAFAQVVSSFAEAEGPVAADAERASGYRYGQSTYLIQLRREGAGTVLIDPVALPDLSALGTAIGDVEWVLHAASQDLPGLAEHGLHPAKVFDTELAARLLSLERVGLGAVVAEMLGLGLAKEHSAVDWSTRPLPEAWLTYAALDVEVLIPLRDALVERLNAAGKLDWAEQEFEAVRTAPPAAARIEPWRRTSGSHTINDTRRLAVVRSLWLARDANARARDTAPGRVLPDKAIVAAAEAMPRSVAQLVALPAFTGKATRRRATLWQRAIDEALALPAADLPTLRGPRTDAPPPPRAWVDRNPEAHARLQHARAVVQAISDEFAIPVENVVQPDALRRLCWTPPEPFAAPEIAEFLRSRGVRRWQVDLVVPRLLTDHPPA